MPLGDEGYDCVLNSGKAWAHIYICVKENVFFSFFRPLQYELHVSFPSLWMQHSCDKRRCMTNCNDLLSPLYQLPRVCFSRCARRLGCGLWTGQWYSSTGGTFGIFVGRGKMLVFYSCRDYTSFGNDPTWRSVIESCITNGFSPPKTIWCASENFLLVGLRL